MGQSSSRLMFLSTAVLGLMALFVMLLVTTNSSQSSVSSMRAEIRIIEDEMLLSSGRGDLAEKIPVFSGRYEAFTARQEFEILEQAYPDAQIPLLISSSFSPEHILALDRFLASVERDQRSSGEMIRALYLSLAIVFALLFLRSESESRRKAIAASLKSDMDALLLESIEREKEIISFDLHDSVLQRLGFIRQRLDRGGTGGPDRAELSRLIRDSIQELRMICTGLRVGDIHPACSDTLDDRLKRLFSEFASIPAPSLSGSAFALEGVPSATGNHIYRMAQELLSNGYKHANASSIKLNVYGLPNCLRLVYTDDGEGLEALPGSLRSIEFRCRLLGARLAIGRSDPGRGLSVQIEVPHEVDTGR